MLGNNNHKSYKEFCWVLNQEPVVNKSLLYELFVRYHHHHHCHQHHQSSSSSTSLSSFASSSFIPLASSALALSDQQTDRQNVNIISKWHQPTDQHTHKQTDRETERQTKKQTHQQRNEQRETPNTCYDTKAHTITLIARSGRRSRPPRTISGPLSFHLGCLPWF